MFGRFPKLGDPIWTPMYYNHDNPYEDPPNGTPDLAKTPFPDFGTCGRPVRLPIKQIRMLSHHAFSGLLLRN